MTDIMLFHKTNPHGIIGRGSPGQERYARPEAVGRGATSRHI